MSDAIVCPICGTEFHGEICYNCGTKADQAHPEFQAKSSKVEETTAPVESEPAGKIEGELAEPEAPISDQDAEPVNIRIEDAQGQIAAKKAELDKTQE